MKRHLLAVLIITVIFTFISCAGSYTVTTQPTRPYYSRPVSPGSNYIWVEGDWRYRNGSYVWREGYWSHPRNNRTWRSGYWQQRNNGWYWRRGRWR